MLETLQARSQFKRRSTANHVEVVVPVPADADSPKFKTSIGSVRYVPEKNVLIWSIKSFPVRPPWLWIASSSADRVPDPDRQCHLSAHHGTSLT